ncbi:hypothetical protein [uncultured Parasphingopyxis sp.]|uniref:hypothetical protein n=1 Tax=uncultured Parasphingopyxis sp. TaxID=1547918 RepID=UPI00262CF53A|nr:hypothetical protein [uncultured Parasphingopyxis sp.]
MKPHAITIAIFSALAACTSPATGQEDAEAPAEATVQADDPGAIADAEAEIAALYEDWENVDNLSPPLPLSPRLSTLFAEERAAVEADPDQISRLDFAWVIAGQDAEISDLEVTHDMAGPDTLHVTASFANFGTPTKVVYIFVRQNDGEWLVDDIRPDDPDGAPISVAQLLSD